MHDADSCWAAGAVPSVQDATDEDVPAAVATLTAAFDGYPWTDWIVPEQDRPRRLTGLFALTVARLGLPYGHVHVVRCERHGDVVGASVVLRPDRPVPATVQAEVAAAEEDLLGDRLAAADEAEASCAPLRPAAPHLTLATLGVRPDHRRRGIATALVARAVRVAREHSAPLYLETSSEDNVAMYRRAGLEVTGRLRVPDGGPKVWAMRLDR